MGDITASAEAKEKPAAKGKTAKTQPSEASLNMDEIRELADLVNEHGFTDFEFENENIRVRLSKQVAAPVFTAPQAYQQAPAAALQTTAPVEAAPAVAAPVDEDANLFKITSPIVGTFYRSAAPDKPSYVSEGSQVSAETVVCIVEAMKLMNEIQAETAGEIVKIYVENGQPVEYGQPLFGIRK
ncbi:MAG TPA: acetyl-CoA carboxylase biotin carboxyl carrier protein [Pyrinomonadaceae bacterium]|nr:acetyl-CoA carboxylase biotin carboxyl carrier protein [Pyrinomonadaceae bacterium]